MKQYTIKQLLRSTTLVVGVSVNLVSFSFSNTATFDTLSSLYHDSLTKDTTLGTGIVVYSGKSNEASTMFLGHCLSLRLYTLKFFGEEGVKLFNKFSEDVLFSEAFQEHLEGFRLNSAEGVQLCLPTNYSSAESYVSGIELLVQSQQKNIPKLEIKNATLFIGGKAGNNSIRISALKSQTGSIESLALVNKVKNINAEKLFDLFITNRQVSFTDVFAFHILQTLNSISSTSLLELFKRDLLKKYSVGSIFVQQGTDRLVLSSSGGYVQRSLKGLFNKLKDSSHSQEAQELLLEWVKLILSNKDSIKNGDTLIQNIKFILEGRVVASTSKASSSTRRTRTRAAAAENVTNANESS